MDFPGRAPKESMMLLAAETAVCLCLNVPQSLFPREETDFLGGGSMSEFNELLLFDPGV